MATQQSPVESVASAALLKYETSPLNKSDWEICLCKIRLFEKKKIGYRIEVSEVYSPDKKTVKRGKKNNHNNKYILFNSWYNSNKERRENALSSHDMWNYIKSHPSAALVIGLFDYMEKLGKSIDAPGEPVSTKKRGGSPNVEVDAEQTKRINDKRSGLYDEFYRVLTVAFKSGSAPASSSVYDLRINNANGVERLNKIVVQTGIDAFRDMLDKLDGHSPVAPDAVPVAVNKRKRKAPAPASTVKPKRRELPVYDMISDVNDDSQMSE
ncbi:39 kDa protein [Lymantria xylina nucleopolyhedrovirus]|uniref:39 kDa protein n=1 Tax=Lymantria xylina multiple nucleopolyhedrovirus TaxID=2847840 RepID=D4N277_9ABAC|nr:39 kDa protein [Lymantria xylina nucleopolyhedrovirus]ADD73749.1 39 kDa protein [Lymantria xylina nucleopolyhedrovirus]